MRFYLPRELTGREIRDIFKNMNENLDIPNARVCIHDTLNFRSKEVLKTHIFINQYIESEFGAFWVQYFFSTFKGERAWYNKLIEIDNKYKCLSLKVVVKNKKLIPDQVILIKKKQHRLYENVNPYINKMEEYFSKAV